MKNKKGWLMIVEASIAVLIVLSAVLILVSRQDVREEVSEDVGAIQIRILNLISKNDTLRAEIIGGGTVEVDKRIDLMLSPGWEFVTKVCNVGDVCSSGDIPLDKEVYTKETLVTSTLENYSPKKLRFFVWRR